MTTNTTILNFLRSNQTPLLEKCECEASKQIKKPKIFTLSEFIAIVQPTQAVACTQQDLECYKEIVEFIREEFFNRGPHADVVSKVYEDLHPHDATYIYDVCHPLSQRTQEERALLKDISKALASVYKKSYDYSREIDEYIVDSAWIYHLTPALEIHIDQFITKVKEDAPSVLELLTDSQKRYDQLHAFFHECVTYLETLSKEELSEFFDACDDYPMCISFTSFQKSNIELVQSLRNVFDYEGEIKSYKLNVLIFGFFQVLTVMRDRCYDPEYAQKSCLDMPNLEI